MGRSGNGMTTYPPLRTKNPNKKQTLRVSINDITTKYFRNFLNKFNNSPYLGCKNK